MRLSPTDPPDAAGFAPGGVLASGRSILKRRQTATIFVADRAPPARIVQPGSAAMASATKALFAVAAVAAVSIGLLLPVPGGRQSPDARGHYELMDVGN
jgi:hypothetical protein